MNKSKLYGLMDLATKLMLINFLWFLTLLTGFVIFTVITGTAALFITVRKLLEDNLAYSQITKIFFEALFKNFLKFTLLGLILALFFGILSSNFIFIFNNRDIMFIRVILEPVMIFIGFSGLMITVNLFMVNVYQPLKLSQLIVSSFKNALARPFNALLRVLALALVAFIVFMFPGLLPVISMNVFAVVSVWVYPKPNQTVKI